MFCSETAQRGESCNMILGLPTCSVGRCSGPSSMTVKLDWYGQKCQPLERPSASHISLLNHLYANFHALFSVISSTWEHCLI